MRALLLLGLAAASAGAAAGGQTGARTGDAWSDYRAIVWQPQRSGNCAALRELGIDAGAVIADRDHPTQVGERVAPLRDCGLGWYLENIATDFYSAYHRYTEGKPANWRFIEVKKAYRENPLDPRVFARDPSLSDPAWQASIRTRLTETVRAHRASRPLFYDLGDEPGIADLSVAWDFDFSAYSLAGMRRWLKERYRNLAALNEQWGSRFSDWDSVVPMTTAEAMRRTDGNYSAWADFKEWMDVEFARAIALGTEAIHGEDPGALSAIEGGQIQGWGGYDYSRLANAVDLMEIYDGGGNVEIVRSLNPELVVLKTSFDRGEVQAYDLWRSLLRGARGVIFWDPKGEIVGEDGRPGARGREAAPHLREIKSGLGALLMRSRRKVAPVAVLYSPASMRMQWMLDWQPKGTAWSDRGPSEAFEDKNAVRSSMTDFLDYLGRAGLEPRIVTPELVGRGALRRGIRALILPRALALSKSEAAEIRRFASAGGTVIADAVPGRFDQHGRRLPAPRLAGLFGSAPGAGKGRAILIDTPARGGRELLGILGEAGVEPPFTLVRGGGARATDIETHLWQNGRTIIVALQRAPGESKLAPVRLELRDPARVYDLRAKKFLGTRRSLELTIDPVVPILLELSKP